MIQLDLLGALLIALVVVVVVGLCELLSDALGVSVLLVAVIALAVLILLGYRDSLRG